jgi:hyperpolarization activated cyclic nucleotide-gated potassium channel 2
VFLTDILMNFTTAYYENGTQVFDRKKIVMNYMRMWFWIDVVSTFPYDTIIEVVIA